jgi:hypothetical protein
MTVREILEEINAQRPITLDARVEANMPFPDDHKFVVQLSAGLFRKVRDICASFEETTKPPPPAGDAA